VSDTLAGLTGKLQDMLLATSEAFPDDVCEIAIRQALTLLNLSIPQHAAETQEAAAGQYEYELEDGEAVQVVDVLREGTDTFADTHTSLPFDAYFEDDRPFIRLRSPRSDGDTLIIRYTRPYTINGLDGETDSTMPASYDAVLLEGAAWKACQMRGAGRIESINMNADVSTNFWKIAGQFQAAFQAGMELLSRRRFPASGAAPGGWGDEWEGQF
jgi:hypothetical protein